MDNKKYVVWYNLAKKLIKDDFLIPSRTDEEIKSFVSPENWFGFAPKDIPSLKELQISDRPNIFLDISDENDPVIGLTYNNLGAVDKIKNILLGFNRNEKEELVKKLSELKPFWRIMLYRKVKDHHQSQRAKYECVIEEPSHKIDEKLIKEIISQSERVRENGKRHPINKANYPQETPVITLMESRDFELSEKTFIDRIIPAFDLLRTCLKVKSESQIKKMQSDNKKEIDELENEVQALTQNKRIWDSMKSIGKLSPEQYDAKISLLEIKKKKLKELQDILQETQA